MRTKSVDSSSSSSIRLRYSLDPVVFRIRDDPNSCSSIESFREYAHNSRFEFSQGLYKWIAHRQIRLQTVSQLGEKPTRQ